MSEEQVAAVHDYAASPLFNRREKLALTYAERITRSDQDADGALFAQLEAQFPPAALVELTATIAFENFRSKFNHALLVESNGFCLLKKGRV